MLNLVLDRKIISLMSFPLSPKGDTVGVASLVLINEGKGFDEKNMQFFSSFANLASIAMEISDFPEGAHKGKSIGIANERDTENIPDRPTSPPEEESGQPHIPLVKIKAETKVEGKKGIGGLIKGKIFRAPNERDTENVSVQSPAPPPKKSQPTDSPHLRISPEQKVMEIPDLPQGPHKGKSIGIPNERAAENIPVQPPVPPPKKSQPTNEPIVKRKAEQRGEEPRIIEGPNNERIAWAPGTVTLKEESGIDRRKEERVETTVRAEFQEEYWGFTKNLSTGGAFIVTSTPLDLGDEIILKLHLPDGGGELEVNCKVVWTNQYGRETQNLRRGMGVKFLNLQPEGQRRIQTYIEFQKNRNLRLER